MTTSQWVTRETAVSSEHPTPDTLAARSQPIGTGTARRRWQRKPTVIAAAVVVLAAVIGVAVVVSSSGSDPVRRFDARGKISVPSPYWQPFVNNECLPAPGNIEGLVGEDTITVNVLGSHTESDTGSVTTGTISGADCIFRFEVDGVRDVKDDGYSYTVSVLDGTATVVSKTDLQHGTTALNYS